MLVPRTLAAGVAVTLGLTAVRAADQKSEPVRPAAVLPLFNGKDLTGLTTWLKDTKADDPRHVFSVEGGLLHISGDGFGYAATAKEYRDYRLVVEYKWGRRTDGGTSGRNPGIRLRASG